MIIVKNLPVQLRGFGLFSGVIIQYIKTIDTFSEKLQLRLWYIPAFEVNEDSAQKLLSVLKVRD